MGFALSCFDVEIMLYCKLLAVGFCYDWNFTGHQLFQQASAFWAVSRWGVCFLHLPMYEGYMRCYCVLLCRLHLHVSSLPSPLSCVTRTHALLQVMLREELRYRNFARFLLSLMMLHIMIIFKF
jgi:hypothetical protein